MLYISACGGSPLDIMASSGTITSPNYPRNYPSNANCVWRITVPPGYRVQLSFSAFNLESHSSCNYDYVELRNGFSSSSPLIAKYCGTSAPTRTANGRSIYVKFRSDGSFTRTGFRASFVAVPVATTQPSGTHLLACFNIQCLIFDKVSQSLVC